MSDLKFWKYVFSLFVLALILTIFIHIWHVLIPFILGLVIAYLVHPLTDRFVSMGLRRDRVVLVLYVILLTSTVVLTLIFLPALIREVKTIIRELPSYGLHFDTAMTKMDGEIHSFYRRVTGKNLHGFAISLKADHVVEMILSKVPQNLANFAHLGLWLLIIPFVSFFGLSDGPRWIDALFDITPSQYVENLLGILAEINATLGAYIRGQILDATCVGLTTMIGLWILDFHGFVLLGFMTGLLNIVPFMAPIIGGGVALLIGYFQGMSLAALFGIVCLYAIVRLMDDFLFMPFIVGSVVRLHPVFMLVGILAGFELGGILGLLFAVPVMAVSKIIVSSVLFQRRDIRLFENQKVVS